MTETSLVCFQNQWHALTHAYCMQDAVVGIANLIRYSNDLNERLLKWIVIRDLLTFASPATAVEPSFISA